MSTPDSKVPRPILFGFLGLVSGLLFWFLASSTFFNSIYESFEARTYDLRARLAAPGGDAVIEDVVIVDIDARSIHKLGRFSRWSRELYAGMLEIMQSDGAAVVAFDILFDPDEDTEADSLFMAAISDYGRVALALDFSLADSNSFLYPMDGPPEGFVSEDHTVHFQEPPVDVWRRDRMEPGVNEFLNNAAVLGFVNARYDPDGVVRRVPPILEFAGENYLSFSFALASALMGWDLSTLQLSDDELDVTDYEGNSFNLPLDGDGNLLLRYRGPFQTFRYVSFYEVVEQRIPPGFFKDKVVFIGTSFAGLSDLKPTPVQFVFPGVEIHATAFHNLVFGDPMRQLPVWVSFIFVMAVAIFAGTSVGMMRVSRAIVSIVLLELIYLLVSILLFDVFHLVTQVVMPGGVLVLTAIVAMSYKYLVEEKEKRWVREAFGHYVSSDVVNELMSDPERLTLGGQRRELTLMFSDIRSFTTISEGMKPEELSALLNRYLTVMTDIVMMDGGTLDKYIGDALVAFFGAPLPYEDHARRAILAALRMQRAIEELRVEFAGTGFESLQAGIGLNTGHVVVGNFGSTQRFDYTAIGDSMNLASRIEGLTKYYKCNILVAGETASKAGNGFLMRTLDKVRVKGKSEPVDLVEVIGLDGFADFPVECGQSYGNAYELYSNGDFGLAHDHFQRHLEKFPSDGPASVMLERCRQIASEPPADWDGVWSMLEK